MSGKSWVCQGLWDTFWKQFCPGGDVQKDHGGVGGVGLRETWGSSSGYRMGRGVCVNAGERLERSKKQFTYETQKIV